MPDKPTIKHSQFGHARQKYHQTLTVWPCQTNVPSNTYSLAMPDKSTIKHSLAMPDKRTIKHSQFGHARQKYHQTLTVWPCQTKVPSNTHSSAMPDKSTIIHSQFGHARQKYHHTLTVWPCQTKVPSYTHSLAMPDKGTIKHSQFGHARQTNVRYTHHQWRREFFNGCNTVVVVGGGGVQ